MMAVIKPFLSWYVAADYFEAWKYTPFLIVGCVYLTMGTFMSTSYTVHKDSMGFLLSGTFGAVLNIILNFALIPVIGVYGAALATCVSYIAVFVFRFFHTRKYIKYSIFTKEFIFGTVFLIGSGILMFSNNVLCQCLQILIAIIALVFFQNVWLLFAKEVFRKFR